MGAVKPFVEGGIAAIIAGASTHPLDLIKVRMQLQGEAPAPLLRPAVAFAGTTTTAAQLPPTPARMGPVAVGVKIVRTEGPLALFDGVSATVLRQALYSTTRMGLYDIFKSKYSDPETGHFSIGRKIVAGLAAGGIGAVVGNPADVAMVRMQADGRLPLEQRRNYSSVGNAIGRMVKNEGITCLWRGSSMTINRAMLVTASQMSTYDTTKEAIVRNGVMRDGLGTHVTASFAAGIVAAVASNPVDVIKTRVMNMKVVPGEAPPYAGPLDCAHRLGLVTSRTYCHVSRPEHLVLLSETTWVPPLASECCTIRACAPTPSEEMPMVNSDESIFFVHSRLGLHFRKFGI